MVRECALRPVLLEFYPLIRHSLIQPHLESEMAEERFVGSKVRLSKLGTRLSSSDDPMGIEVDTVMSKPSTSSSSKTHLKNFGKCFQFPIQTKIRLLHPSKKFCAFTHGHMCFYEVNFLCGLRFPIHPFIHELLDHFKIDLGQLVPNAWWIVVSVMSIWTSVHVGGIVSLNEFPYLYYLKPSTHYGYFEFYPLDRNSRVIRGLPSVFFFVARSLGTSSFMERNRKWKGIGNRF